VISCATPSQTLKALHGDELQVHKKSRKSVVVTDGHQERTLSYPETWRQAA
jgi:hypothetical protein